MRELGRIIEVSGTNLLLSRNHPDEIYSLCRLLLKLLAGSPGGASNNKDRCSV